MESKAKIFGHSIHQMLIVFPLGLLATSLAFDIAFLSTRDTTFAMVAYYMIFAGICGGLLAAVFGLIDWLAIPSHTRAKAIGGWHGAGNLIVVLLFLASCISRYPAPEAPSSGAITCSVIGVLLALVTGWLGGELVTRLGVGVDPGANLNSPSSLSGRPASDSQIPIAQNPGTHHA